MRVAALSIDPSDPDGIREHRASILPFHGTSSRDRVTCTFPESESLTNISHRAWYWTFINTSIRGFNLCLFLPKGSEWLDIFCTVLLITVLLISLILISEIFSDLYWNICTDDQFYKFVLFIYQEFSFTRCRFTNFDYILIS